MRTAVPVIAVGALLGIPGPAAGEPPPPANPAMDAPTRQVLRFLQQTDRTLAGQQEPPGHLHRAQEEVFRITGRRPAVRGWDLRPENPDPAGEAIDSWKRRRQLVTLCYHMGLPPLEDTYAHARVAATESDLDEILQPGTPRHQAYLAKLDHASGILRRLAEAGVPVLWRPLHEAEGDSGQAWFWWSRGGPVRYRQLWRLTFDHLTRVQGLNNLIWVYSANRDPRESVAGEGSAWYPGNDWCDVVGTDVYVRLGDPANPGRWAGYHRALREMAPGKPVALTENDVIPPPGRSWPWTWFLTWHGEFLAENPPASLRSIYQAEEVLTAEEMPDWTAPSPHPAASPPPP